jgi:hypothetical protein
MPAVAVLAGLELFKSAWAAILLYHAVIAAYIFLTRSKRPRPGLFYGWSSPSGPLLVLLSACTVPLLVLLWPYIERTPDSLESVLVSFGLSGPGRHLFAAYFVTIHPVLEELFWREAVVSREKGIDISDLAFSAYHVIVLIHFMGGPWVIAAFAVLIFISWLWRRERRLNRGLAVPVISHAAAGTGIMAAVYYIVSR